MANKKPTKMFPGKGPHPMSRWTFWGAGIGESKRNIMSNATRRKLGLSQDPDLPDYKKEK